MKTLQLDGKSLSIDDAVFAARGEAGADGIHRYPRVELHPDVRAKIANFRKGLEERGEAGDVIYGYNTGCGIRKNVKIPDDQIVAYQRHYIPAHCVGFGNPFPEEVVRLAIVLRVNSFALGNSGVRLELCERLLELYNAGVIPFVPKRGSVGSSGDLCCLAHVSATMMGLEGQQAWYQGELMTALEALQRAEIKPIMLAGKEAMALTNGATFILALAILGTADLETLLWHSNMAAALSLEAIRGEKNAFDPRIHEARPHPGQIEVAQRILSLTHGSNRMSAECQAIDLEHEALKRQPDGSKVPRVQDQYSFRCYAQTAGPAVEALAHAREVLTREMNASTDNPLIFQEADGAFVGLSGGNFHGEPLAVLCEQLKLVAQSLANVSDRRFFAMLDPHLCYGLPPDLAGSSELNTGLMIAQYATAALVSENKVLCHPAVADSVPTSSGQEDYVSMGTISARHLRSVIRNSTAVVAWELIAAAQGISRTQEPLCHPSLGCGTAVCLEVIRDFIAEMSNDRYLYADHLRAIELIQSGKIRHAVEKAIN